MLKTPYLTGLLFERFTVNTFNLIRGILRCETYRPAKTVEGKLQNSIFSSDERNFTI